MRYVVVIIQEAIEFHLERMQTEGLSIPKPTSITHKVEVFSNPGTL